MNVAVNGGQHQRALAGAFTAFKIIFEMRDGFFHYLGGLQYEGQDQFTGAEFITNFFHGWQQHLVEDLDGAGALGLTGWCLGDQFIDVCLNAFLDAVNDLPLQTFISFHMA